MAPCNVSQKKQQLIKDLEDLINCIQIRPSEKPVSKKNSSTRQKLVCIPCPAGDGKRKTKSNADSEDWKKDRYKSRELKSGVLYIGCQCPKRNGLQHDCQRTDCMGRPPCLVKPWPDCLPSGGTGLKGSAPKESKYPYKPAPCPAPEFPKGVQEDPCHKAGMDCKKCEPVLMCRPGEVWECSEGKCPPNQQAKPMKPNCTTCPDNDGNSGLRKKQDEIGCPKKAEHQRPGYESPQKLCRPADPQPVQEIVHSSCDKRKGQGDGNKCCDPPTHVLKRPAYEELPEVPNCPKPKVIHHPCGKILPDFTQLRGGKLIARCDCVKTNGLQDECRLQECGIPECLLRPPDCLPAGGKGKRIKRTEEGDDEGKECDGNDGPTVSSCPAGFKRYICFLPCGDDDN